MAKALFATNFKMFFQSLLNSFTVFQGAEGFFQGCTATALNASATIITTRLLVQLVEHCPWFFASGKH